MFSRDNFPTAPLAQVSLRAVPRQAAIAPQGEDQAPPPAPTAEPPPPPPDELGQAAAARDLLNRLAAEGRIVLRLGEGGKLVVSRLVPRTVYDEEELP